MNSFQALSIQHSGGVAGYKNAVRERFRHRVPSADRHGLGAIANHLAAFQKLRHEWVRFESLQLMMRIDARIAIIETYYTAEVQNSVAHAVDPGSSEGM